MKKYIIILLILLISPINSAFAAKTEDPISAVENSIFGYDYVNDSDIKRVERLEEHLYGAKKTGPLNKRIEDIKNDIGYSNPSISMPNSEQNTNKSIAQEKKNRDAEAMNLKEDSSVEYPMVDRMEEEIFNTKYKNETIYSRLNRLEMRVFNKTSNEDLNTRVDRLASVISPQKKRNQTYDTYTSQDIDNYYSNSGLEAVNNNSLPFQLEALEKEIFKNSYMNENNANRLSRLEQNLFKRNFPNDTDVTRLQRLMVAYNAKQDSYKYENNRKMQNVATASQIGGILLLILSLLL